MAPNDDDDVGYKRPPKHTRFQKGQSGNPKGRPRGAKNIRTDLAEELAELIHIREGDKEYKVSKQRAVIKVMVSAAVKGDMRAVSSLLSLYGRLFGLTDVPAEEANTDQLILEDYLARDIARRKLTRKAAPRSTPPSSED